MNRKIWLLISIGLIGILIFAAAHSNIITNNDDLKNLSISAAASAIIVVIIEALQIAFENANISYLKGKYKRTIITNAKDERDMHGIYDNMTKRYENKKVNSDIFFYHKGDGRYTGKAFYEQGEVKFDISLNKQNPLIGDGVYQYVETDDIGTYTLQVDIKNKNRLYIFYQNVLPNGLAKGYEIWEKQ